LARVSGVRAGFRSAERTHFAGGEVEDAGFVAGLCHFEESAAAGEFDVVWMCGDGEKVEIHGSSVIVRHDCMRAEENVKTLERFHVRTLGGEV